MATQLLSGPSAMSLGRDDEGHRTYKVTHKVRRTGGSPGPAAVLNTPGLPRPGSVWRFLDDLDIWAYCSAKAEVRQIVPNEEWHWEVDQYYSTKPPDANKQRCQDQKIENPLLEPPRISGTSAQHSEEVTHDRFNRPALTSSHEQIRGQQMEFSYATPIIKVEKNIQLPNLGFYASMLNSVNNAVLWGMPRRTVRFSNFTWERKLYGACFFYYTVSMEFELNYRTFDRDLLDEGTKVLNGHWSDAGEWVLDPINGQTPDPSNPKHFIKFTDRNGNPARVVLNGLGVPAGAPVTAPTTTTCTNTTATYTNWEVTFEGLQTTNNLLDLAAFNCNCSTLNGKFNLVQATGGPTAEQRCYWESLTINSGCDDIGGTMGVWRLTVGTDTVTLAFLDYRVVGDAPATAALYSLSKDSFDPLAANTLAYVRAPESCENWPSSVTIVPYIRETSIGNRRIERYPDANLLLLGIPVRF